MKNSRFITYPSTIETNSNHKVIVVDATAQEISQLERFLQTSQENFDVYLYQGDHHDLEWLNYVNSDARLTLINDSSQVKITPGGIRYDGNLIGYFEQIEHTSLDTAV